MKKLFLFLTTALFATSMWAESTYSYGFDYDVLKSYDGSATLLKTLPYDGTVIDLSSTYSISTGYVTSTSVKDSCFAIANDASQNYDTYYLQIQSTEDIKSIYLVAAVTGSTSASEAVAVGWTGVPEANIAEYHTFSTPGKGDTKGKEITINFTNEGIRYVRLYRKIKLDAATKTKFQSSSSVTIPSGASTYGVAFIKVTTESSLPEATKYNVGVTGNNPCVSGGESATITLSGSQSGVSYQLYKDAVAVSGAIIAGTGSAISFTEIVEAGTYTVKSIANATYCATTMTGSAVVTLASSPVITTQPTASQTVAIKTVLELSVESSTEGVSYQWYSNTSESTEGATELTGKNEATLNIKAASTETTMYYYCILSKEGLCSLASDFAEVITKLGCEADTIARSTIASATTDTHSGCETAIKVEWGNGKQGKLGSGCYVEMSLTGGFKAGDIVKVHAKGNDMAAGKLYMVYGTRTSYSGYQVQDGPANGATGDVEFEIPSNMNTIAFLRKTAVAVGDSVEQNHEIRSIKVARETCYLDDAPISWILNKAEVSSLTVYLDKEITLPTLSNEEELTVSYTSSNTSVAEITAAGVCTVVGPGNTTISAAFAGNEDYKATEVSYSLTVIAQYPTALDNTEAGVKAVKRLENGMLIIEKNGVRYNAQGQIVR